MAKDFGGHDRPRWRAGQRLAAAHALGAKVFLGAALLLIASLPIVMPMSLEDTVIWGHRKPAAARDCRPITQAEFNRGWTDDPRIFTFSGVTFARRRADADCTAAKHGLFGVVGEIYPTCHFDAPFALAVIRGRRTEYFAVPGGFKADVEAAPDATRCRVTAPYDIYAIEG